MWAEASSRITAITAGSRRPTVVVTCPLLALDGDRDALITYQPADERMRQTIPLAINPGVQMAARGAEFQGMTAVMEVALGRSDGRPLESFRIVP